MTASQTRLATGELKQKNKYRNSIPLIRVGLDDLLGCERNNFLKPENKHVRPVEV